MNTPQPPQPPASQLSPSSSTVYSGASGALTVILVWVVGLFHVTVPPEISVSLGVIITTVVGYVTEGGRVKDIKG